MISRCGLISRRARLAAVSLLLIGALGACAGAAREPLESLSELQGGETIVVGRVELVPPLSKEEQKFNTLNTGRFENTIILITDEHYRVLTKEPELADYAGRIEAKLGQDFFVRSSSKPFFIVGGMLMLPVGSKSISRIYFPGGLKISIKSGDKAVYIGTIRYHRDEFFEVTKATIIDDYDQANAEFKKKFGKVSLHKALVTPVK